MPPGVPPLDEGGVFAPARRALTAGLVLTITLVGFEALAVATVLPVVEQDLGDLALYGWVFSAYLLAGLVGTVIAGREADRRGPGPPFVAGCVLFATGLVAAGLAPSMPLLVLARVVQGLGAGVVPAVAYAVIGRCYPAAVRPRMFAVLSTAWVVPALAGPALAGVVAHGLGWRWVFLGLVPLVGLAAAMTLPALFRVGPAPETEADASDLPDVPESARTSDAVLVAVGAGLVIGGLTASDIPWLMPVLILLGALVGVPPFMRLVPAGTLRARAGLPADVLARGVLTFAFFGTDAFVPLLIQNVRHQSVTYTGIVLTASTLSWTAAAWVQQHFVHRRGPRFFVRLGFGLIAAGIVGVAAALSASVPVGTIVVSWSIGAAGMGCAYAPLSLVMFDAAEPGREGAASASLQLSDQLGFALGTGVAGAAVALGEVSGWAESTSLLLGAAITGAVAVLGLVLARRLPPRLRLAEAVAPAEP
ncbi:MAG TPA: MFS transporter [Acidimicrobiia bacterium]|jgi:MFS family permease